MAKRNSWLLPAGTDGYLPISMLWHRFSSIYGQKWRSLFADDAAKIAWQEEGAALMHLRGISWVIASGALEDIRKTVKADSEPIGLAEFADRCLPQYDYEGAFLEAKAQAGAVVHGSAKWSDPVVYWAAHDFGFTRIQTANWSRAKGNWVRLLSKRLQEKCPAIPEKREEPVYRRGDEQQARSALDSLHAALAACQPGRRPGL